MAKRGKRKRINTYFRQTAKAFKAARQTQVFSHIKRSLPFKMYQFSKEGFNRGRNFISAKYKGKVGSLRKKTPPS